jgi:hypothetical protein
LAYILTWPETALWQALDLGSVQMVADLAVELGQHSPQELLDPGAIPNPRNYGGSRGYRPAASSRPRGMVDHGIGRAGLLQQRFHLAAKVGVTWTGLGQKVLSPRWLLLQGCVVKLLDLAPAFGVHRPQSRWPIS